MLTPKVIELTNQLIQVQFDERRQLLSNEILAVAEKLNARGLLYSSIRLDEVRKLCAHEVGIRAQIVFQCHARVLSQLAIEPYPNLSAELKERLAYFLPLSSDYSQALEELASRLSLMSKPDTSIVSSREHALKKIGAEIDLFVESALRLKQSRKEHTAETPVYNIFAPVGALQTGAGSTATVVQHIGTEDKQALLEALSLVREALTKLPDTPGFPRAEIIELVGEADLEIKKPSPNGVKLSSVLTTIGNYIQTLGTLQSIYQTFKAALLPFGISLP